MGSLVRTDANNAFCRLFSFHVKPRWKSCLQCLLNLPVLNRRSLLLPPCDFFHCVYELPDIFFCIKLSDAHTHRSPIWFVF